MDTTHTQLGEWPIVGHELAVRQLQMAVAGYEAVAHALLISGPESVGKTTLARRLATALHCTAESARPCDQCRACRKMASGNHPDFLFIEPEQSGGALKIDQIRTVERFLSLTPNESLCKVVLIRLFDRATIGAANALLKTLEEPQAYAHLILLADDVERLLPTIISRVQHLALRPVARRAIETALIERWQCEPHLAQRLARIAGGRIGWAIRASANPASVETLEHALSDLFELLTPDRVRRFEKARALSQSETLTEVLEFWRTAWRDVLLLQNHVDAGITFQEQAAQLQQMAQQLPATATLDALHMLERAANALERNANAQLVLENLVLALPELRIAAL